MQHHIPILSSIAMDIIISFTAIATGALGVASHPLLLGHPFSRRWKGPGTTSSSQTMCNLETLLGWTALPLPFHPLAWDVPLSSASKWVGSQEGLRVSWPSMHTEMLLNWDALPLHPPRMCCLAEPWRGQVGRKGGALGGLRPPVVALAPSLHLPPPFATAVLFQTKGSTAAAASLSAASSGESFRCFLPKKREATGGGGWVGRNL